MQKCSDEIYQIKLRPKNDLHLWLEIFKYNTRWSIDLLYFVCSKL